MSAVFFQGSALPHIGMPFTMASALRPTGGNTMTSKRERDYTSVFGPLSVRSTKNGDLRLPGIASGARSSADEGAPTSDE